VRSALPALWRRLLEAGDVHGSVVVAGAEGPSKGALAGGIAVFIDEYLAAPTPHLSSRIYERILSDRSPVLPLKRVAAANAARGLNLLILHFFLRYPPPLDEQGRLVLGAAHSSFQRSHGGYRIRRVVQDAYEGRLRVCRRCKRRQKDGHRRTEPAASVAKKAPHSNPPAGSPSGAGNWILTAARPQVYPLIEDSTRSTSRFLDPRGRWHRGRRWRGAKGRCRCAVCRARCARFSPVPALHKHRNQVTLFRYSLDELFWRGVEGESRT
jgi:hypothetical protein